MVKIAAAELQKHFGRYRDIALKSPVSVTHHGRDSLVLLSAEEYTRLKALDNRKALYAWELPADAVEALDEANIPAEGAAFDHEYK
ncbi:MAG: type II toxin-antitoxin system Phd/YefM family antitoxin [Tepidamorphaceae bacterium]